MSTSNQTAERIARQNRIDETCVDTLWTNHVDGPLCALLPKDFGIRAPQILLPELRFKSLLRTLMNTLPEKTRLMIIDDNSSRFDGLRECAQSATQSMYFSTQRIEMLNYADNSFHAILSELSLAAVCRAERVFTSFYRVLKPNGCLMCASPSAGTFPAYFDIFEECLETIAPQKCQELMQIIHTALDDDSISELFTSLGFDIESSQKLQFTLEFQTTEQLLFSTLVETHYLGFCLSLGYPDIDGRKLLTQLVRSFHHYFQDSQITVPIRRTLYHLAKK